MNAKTVQETLDKFDFAKGETDSVGIEELDPDEFVVIDPALTRRERLWRYMINKIVVVLIARSQFAQLSAWLKPFKELGDWQKKSSKGRSVFSSEGNIFESEICDVDWLAQ